MDCIVLRNDFVMTEEIVDDRNSGESDVHMCRSTASGPLIYTHTYIVFSIHVDLQRPGDP